MKRLLKWYIITFTILVVVFFICFGNLMFSVLCSAFASVLLLPIMLMIRGILFVMEDGGPDFHFGKH